MITSSFLTLADGNEVRFDFSPPSKLDFQLLDPTGHALAPEVSVVGEQLAIDVIPQLDAFGASALTGGGFVVAYEERHSIVGAGFQSETLKTAVFDAHGHFQGSFALPAGSFPAGTTISGPGVFSLSGDAFAVAFDRQDGAAVSHHLALSGPGGLTDLTLSGAATSVQNSNGVLTLGFADGTHVVAGGDGADMLKAGPKGDLIRAGGGNDSVQGGAGADDINGNGGDDLIQGGVGAEILRGGQGNDSISGGAGNDFISGDRGDDTLSGGAGADLFHGSLDSGRDVITDFNAAEGDHIQLDAGTPFTVSQAGSDVIIHLGVNHDVFTGEIILKNVQLSSLPPGFITLG